MMNMKPVLLYTFSWISVLALEFNYVEVQPGEEVTLQCSNLSSYPVHLFWFRKTNRPKASRISSMTSPDKSASFYEGFQNVKFNMTSNTSVLFLEIKQVDSSDSGLYFCGDPKNEKFIVYGATNLKVQDGSQNLSSMILGSLTVFLFLVIIGLVFKIRNFQTAQDDGKQHMENVESDVKITAGLSFHLRKRVPQRELETNVVYAAMSTK
uniref:Ig-like domain-containing protein n=1 Tax=Oreochromis niloticus TaxID=8128 RepID=A0A669CRG7_ORENI